MNKKLLAGLSALVVITILAFIVLTPAAASDATREKMTIYKSPQCGCCVGYSHFMEKQGFEVELVSTNDMEAVKKRFNIPKNMQSCHTTVVGNYFVEGHVPIEAVNRLLEEKPDIDGIALPNMPSGTPGMPGLKVGDYKIYSLSDGIEQEWMVM